MDDMRKRDRSPRWGILYILFAGAVGLLWLEGRSRLTPFDHEAALVGIVLVFFALTWVWLGREDGKWQ